MADTVSEFFAQLPTKIDPARINGMNATFQFNIAGDGGSMWQVALKDGAAVIKENGTAAPDITIAVSAQDWLDIVHGRLSGQAAFLTGRLKVQGDMGLALKLQALLQA